MLTGAASVITYQLSLKGKAAADVAEVAKRLNITSAMRNRGMQSYNGIYRIARMSFICHIHNYTEYNEEWNVFSAFNPSKCTHLEQWAADCAAPGDQSWTSCRSRDSNPQPWVTSGFKSNALSIRPTTARLYNAECHGVCRSLDELIKSRSVHLNRLALWTSIYKY